MNIGNWISTILVTLTLAGCGGGGGSPTPVTPVVQAPIEPTGDILQLETALSIGQSTELVLYAPENQISNISWRQTAGAELEFYASNSKVIGFSPNAAGSYTLEVD